jgi:hypothetical protein
MKDLSIVLQHLSKGCTCAAADGSTLLTSEKRGVAPLLGWLEQGYHLSDFTAADKVVGKGAAFLYLLLGVKYLYAGVISRPALELLKKNGVFVTYSTCVAAIRNRDNTGFCPIESAVLDCDSPEQALIKIQKRLQELRA